MAGTVTKYNSDNRAIERDPVCLIFEYLAETGASKSEEAVLMVMPANVKIISVQTQTLIADVGSGNVTVGIKHGTTSVFTGAADSGGTINTMCDGVSSGALIPSADTTAAANLICDYDTASGTCTTAAKWRILVTCLRTSF